MAKKTAEQLAADKEYQDFLDEASEIDTGDEEDLIEDDNEEVSPVPGADQSGTNIEAKSDELDSEGLKVGEGDITPPLAAEPPAAQPPADASAQPPSEGQKEAIPPAQEPAKADAPPPETPPSPLSNDQITQVYTDWRKNAEDLLAKHHYNLTEDDIAAIDSGTPQEVIPKMMARVYLDAVTASVNQVLQYMPTIVRQVNEQSIKNDESENAFFNSWPDLKAHKETVIKIGQTYRQLNPRASAEQFINEVGAAAMVSLRLDPSVKQATPPVATPPPFVPAAQTPQGGVPQKPKETNVFTQLNSEFEEDADF